MEGVCAQAAQLHYVDMRHRPTQRRALQRGRRTWTRHAHARPHTALFLPDTGVLVAGDMLSDVEIPLLDLSGDDPVADYAGALAQLEDTDARIVVPGHGRVGHDLQRRLAADRSYLATLVAGEDVTDERLTLPWTVAAHAAHRTAVGR
jgi:glyoxylase-like metal-dependent hydrolase (beta-lactamase superfamily II)